MFKPHAHAQVIKAVLRLACVHEVTIDSSYASLAVSVCVLVGVLGAGWDQLGRHLVDSSAVGLDLVDI